MLTPAALKTSATMRIVAGVDSHKSTHTIVFIDELGRMIEILTIPTSPDGYRTALSVAAKLRCSKWGIEGSGLYGYAFGVFIAESGSPVFEVPGVYTKRHRRHSSRHGKSDVNDAQAIAEALLREEDRLPSFFLATMQRALRVRYDQRDRLVRERTKAINRLRSAALRLAITDLPSDLTPLKVIRRISGLASTFRASTLLDPASVAVLDEVEESAEAVEQLGRRIRILETIIKALVQPIASELLELHGVSGVVAAGLIGHAGDVRNLRDASAFATKAGAAPVECSSGKRETVRVNLGGDRQLNRLLHIVAMSQVRKCGHPGRLYYDRKRSEGKTHLAAMRCLKRTLATVIFYRLRDVARRLERGGTDSLAA
jgi:transposase